MIAVNVTSSSGHRVRLLLTPDNLYVRGFIAENGAIWEFNPGNDPYNVQITLNTLRQNGADQFDREPRGISITLPLGPITSA